MKETLKDLMTSYYYNSQLQSAVDSSCNMGQYVLLARFKRMIDEDFTNKELLEYIDKEYNKAELSLQNIFDKAYECGEK